jgi:mannose-6-phosphate isomerase-like protein (cupin superfamily)
MSMQFIPTDRIDEVPKGSTPDYQTNNPLLKLMDIVETIDLAAERECYLHDQLQYLIPYDYLEMYGPAGDDSKVLDPKVQDNKTDFQKQNVKTFRTTDTIIARGWATADGWTGPFLHLSYRAGPDSKLAAAANYQLGDHIRLYLKVGNAETRTPLAVPYNPDTNRYEIELWGYPGTDLGRMLDQKGAAAFARGGLIPSPDGLVQGAYDAFAREKVDGQYMANVAPAHTMHPVLPLTIQAAWADETLTHWDSEAGANYTYQFNMFYRGWDNYLGVGVSSNPHGGVGFLHYRNVLSNYGRYSGINELGREVEPWMLDATGTKSPSEKRERWLSVDYMDLHIIRPGCGIGLHRHRDNQEIFFMVDGTGIMVTGDWLKLPERERCFEIRRLAGGSFSLIKPGNLHALFNSTDENLSLLMFGGYD